MAMIWLSAMIVPMILIRLKTWPPGDVVRFTYVYIGENLINPLTLVEEKNNLNVVRLRFRGAKKVNKCCMFCIL